MNGTDDTDGTCPTHGTGPARVAARLLRTSVAALMWALALGPSAGCGTTPGADGDPFAPGGTFDAAVASDLGDVLEQTFESRVTTVQLSRDTEDGVTRTIASRLSARGFGVRRVDGDRGPNLLVHTRVTDRRETDTVITARVALGTFAVRRDYRVDEAGRVRTAGPLRVYGAPTLLPLASLSNPGLQIADPAHLDIEYVAARRTEPPS